jgi:hypothetical protein
VVARITGRPAIPTVRFSAVAWPVDFALPVVTAAVSAEAETSGVDTEVVLFDTGCNRRRAWAHRPWASALLAALADPDRGFDAVVVGEYERAFCGDQLARLAPMLERYGVPLWLPEAGGPIDSVPRLRRRNPANVLLHERDLGVEIMGSVRALLP